MNHRHVAVIGNGPAGREAAFTLRRLDPDIRITVFSRETAPFYPPHLLPKWISGEVSREDLLSCSTEAYISRNVRLRLGQEVAALNLNRRELILEHREIVPFSGLILALGGRPHIPEPLLGFKHLMLTLKTLQDAEYWIDRLHRTESVLILGGDLTSLALTRTLLHLGKQVLFVLQGESFWPLRCTPGHLAEVAHCLSRRGVTVLEETRLTGLTPLPDGRMEARIDGRIFRADLVGAFFGLEPQVRFLTRTGLRVDRGILVDEYLNTGMEGIYAAGDCAQVYHPEIRDYWVSIGYDNACGLGRIAAHNLLGEHVRTRMDPSSIYRLEGVQVNTSWWRAF